VHPFVSTEIGELRVRFEADLALERLNAAVDVLVLLQTARGREGFATVWARVSPGAAHGVRRSIYSITTHCLQGV